jgi:transposase
VTTHHGFLIGHRLGLIEELEQHIAAFDSRIDALLAPCRDFIARLITIPGVSIVSAQVILAEIGTDMTPFPTAGLYVRPLPRLFRNPSGSLPMVISLFRPRACLQRRWQ